MIAGGGVVRENAVAQPEVAAGEAAAVGFGETVGEGAVGDGDAVVAVTVAFNGTATVVGAAVRDEAVRERGATSQVSTAAVIGGIAVADGEAIHYSWVGEMIGLVQQSLAVLAVQNGDVRGGVALRQVGLVAGKAAVQAHAIDHLERAGGDGVAVIDTLGHPDVGVVHLGETESVGNIAERVVPARSGVVATAIHLHIDGVSVIW